MTREEIIFAILDSREEDYIRRFLNQRFEDKYKAQSEMNRKYRATLRVVKKLNKNKAIANLLESSEEE